MNRRTAREHAFIALFTTCFGTTVEESLAVAQGEESEFPVDDFGEKLINLYNLHSEDVNKRIEENLKGWRMERIQKVNLSVMRLAVTEMLFGDEDMDSVIINEAVEISKKYGDEQDYQFVNGVLGSVSRGRNTGNAGE